MKAYIVTVDERGTKSWYLNGELHSEDGPAIERCDGNRYWYQNGKRHREDGPAVEFADGTRVWYLHGVPYSEEQFTELMRLFLM